MKKLICLPQFDLAGMFYIVHFGLRTFSINYNGSFLRNHFADFLALIVILPIIVNIEHILDCRKTKYISLKEIVLYAILFSIVFEIISPYFIHKGTACIIDCFCYLIGGTVLYYSQYITGELDFPRQQK